MRSIDMRYVGPELGAGHAGAGRRDCRRTTSPTAAELFEPSTSASTATRSSGEELEMLTFNVAAVGTRHAVELPRLERGAPARCPARAVVFAFGVEARSRRRSTTATLPAPAPRSPARRCRAGRRDDATAARQRGARRRLRQSHVTDLKEADDERPTPSPGRERHHDRPVPARDHPQPPDHDLPRDGHRDDADELLADVQRGARLLVPVFDRELRDGRPRRRSARRDRLDRPPVPTAICRDRPGEPPTRATCLHQRPVPRRLPPARVRGDQAVLPRGRDSSPTRPTSPT